MKKALVLGKGKSGQSAKMLLEEIGYKVNIRDTNEIENVKDRSLKSLSFICVSPGISIDNEIVKRAKKFNIPICGELELGYKNLSCKIVAITGTNGKTTTTALVGEMCKRAKTTFVGGNIGVPVTSFCNRVKKDDLCVLEVSSFQAESFECFKPYIGVFLNFTDDHLDRHKSRETYFNAKLNLFKNQTSKDYAVLGYDDAVVRALKDQLKSKVYFFSTKSEVKGCFLKRGYIYFNDGVRRVRLFRMPSNICGEHNEKNILAAITVCKLLGIDNNVIEQCVREFKVECNRIEKVATINGVTFVNDSKSTNVASTLAAVNSFKEGIVLVVGGSDKGYDFSSLFAFNKTVVKSVVAVGQTADKIVAAANVCGYANIFKAEGFEKAIRKAYSLANSGEVVLLSPACASFDMFKDYKHRGDEFKRVVKEIKNENNKNAGVKKA